MATVRLLVTGATGFIGRHVLAQLALRKDITVVASARSIPAALPSRIAFDQADLLEAEGPADLIARVQPTHLLHLAWDARPGLFWTTPGNLRWAAATLDLFESFVRVGGKRAVFAGSGAEYDWTGPSLLSESAETRPATLYGVAKDAVRRIVCMPFASGVSVAWGRVFWLYGDHEPAGSPRFRCRGLAGVGECRRDDRRASAARFHSCRGRCRSVYRGAGVGACRIVQHCLRQPRAGTADHRAARDRCGDDPISSAMVRVPVQPGTPRCWLPT